MMKGEMREEARTKDGKRERQDRVSRERKEGRKVSRGVRRLLSITHSCHLASMRVNVSFLLSIKQQDTNTTLRDRNSLRLRISNFGLQLFVSFRMGRCSYADNLVALWLCLKQSATH